MNLKLIYYLFLLLFATNCKKDGAKKTTNNSVVIDSISIKKEHLIKKLHTPNSFKKEGDILLDSLFIDIPSEGTIVRVFSKGKEDKLYISNSIATMNKYDWEVYIKKDSTFLIENTRTYNQPLSMVGAKLENEVKEYVSYYNDDIILFVRNDTIIKNPKELYIKKEEVKFLMGKISKKAN